jgi:hypothetical protein
MADLLTNLKAVLCSTPLRWNTLAQTFPEDLLRRQPQSGEWSALECLQHLIDVDRILFPVRIRAILAGEVFPPFDITKQGPVLAKDATPTALAAEFEALRANNLNFLESISEEDLNRPGTHPALGPVTLGQTISNWGGHDLMHLVQAEQAMMQAFIEGCGPWKSFYTAHIATAAEK